MNDPGGGGRPYTKYPSGGSVWYSDPEGSSGHHDSGGGGGYY